MKHNDWMSLWIVEVHQISFQLTQMGVSVDDEEIILVLTMGLPPSYQTFIGTLENVDNLTLNYVTIAFSMKNPASLAAFRLPILLAEQWRTKLVMSL